MRSFPKSDKLEHVCYDIRGPVHKEALRLEEEGNKILKLNIGNPAPFGFEAPDEILVDVIRNLPSAQGYCDSKGLYSARKAIVQYYQSKGIHDAVGEDFLTVTPGIRLASDAKDDQKRVTTPAMAKDMTSSYIVVGRTITKAADPVAAYKEVFNQFQGE